MVGLDALARFGDSALGVTRALRADATERQALEHGAHRASLEQMSSEFAHPSRTWFDATVDGLNRLPRPLLAFGTLGLFVFAMVDPARFAERMEGLGYVPDPLWWLLGAIVGFYFGARELHYLRDGRPGATALPPPVVKGWHHTDGTAERGGALRDGSHAAGMTNVTEGVGFSANDAGTDPAHAGAAAAGDNPALAEWRRAAA